MIGAVIAMPVFNLSDDACQQLFEILGKMELVLVSEDMGGMFFISNAWRIPASKVISIGRISEKNYPLRFHEFVETAYSNGAEIIVTVGGDGIASYTATAIIGQNIKSLGVLGFPAGTGNVGPIVKHDHNGKSLLKKTPVDSIEVSCGGRILGYGFNDVIIGRNFLGTLNGKCVNLSAHAMAEKGIALQNPMEDKEVVGSNFGILLNGREISGIPSVPIKQICISTLQQDNLYGRAVFGGLSESYGFKHPAALALLDKISNDARSEIWGMKEIRVTSHLCFDETDTVQLLGIDEDCCVIIDGNPFEIKGGPVILRCVPGSILVYGNWR